MSGARFVRPIMGKTVSMSTLKSDAVRQASGAAAQAAQQTKPWVERLARLGYGAKGVIYLVIGVLAMQASFGVGRGPTNTQGALQVILGQPFGRILLALVAIGLVGYALWRILTALLDVEHEGTDAKGIVTRIGYAVSGLIYGGLAWTALRLLTGSPTDRGNWAQALTARMLSAPSGQWLVGAAGLLVVAVGLYNLYAAYKAPFVDKLDLAGLKPQQRSAVIGLGRLGYGARGVVFGLIGIYLTHAALSSSSQGVRGMQGAQTSLAHQPGGPWILCAVAVGLVAYSLFMLVEARYHRIHVP